MEDQVRAAILDELKRQTDVSSEFEVSVQGERIVVSGVLDLDGLAMAVVGAVAGGP